MKTLSLSFMESFLIQSDHIQIASINAKSEWLGNRATVRARYIASSLYTT